MIKRVRKSSRNVNSRNHNYSYGIQKQHNNVNGTYICKLIFKQKHFTCKSLVFYGDRKSQILHTRLRLKCSSLNNNLFLKNIVDSPICVCGESESNHHYLYECPL